MTIFTCSTWNQYVLNLTLIPLTDHDMFEDLVEFIEENAPVIAASGLALSLLTTISTGPLPMFPPQGVPQPGAVSGGGGFSPARVIGVSTVLVVNLLNKA